MESEEFLLNAQVRKVLVKIRFWKLEVRGTQEFIIQDADGEKATVIVEEMPGNARVDAGTYKVKYDALGWTAGFYIKVSNNKLTSVYSSFYSLNWGSVSNVKLTKKSDIKATLSFIYKAVAVFETLIYFFNTCFSNIKNLSCDYKGIIYSNN